MDLGRTFCNVGSDFRAPGEEHVVEWQRKEFFPEGDACSQDDGDFILFEEVFEKRFQEGSHMGSLVAWLCNDYVPGRDCRDDGRDGKQERIVPGRHDEHAAHRFKMAAAFVCRKVERPACGLVFHPFREVVYGVVDFFEGGEYFAKPGFHLGLVEVCPDGIVECLLALNDGFAQLMQFDNAFPRSRVRDCPTLFALCLEKAVYFFDAHYLTHVTPQSRSDKCVYFYR